MQAKSSQTAQNPKTRWQLTPEPRNDHDHLKDIVRLSKQIPVGVLMYWLEEDDTLILIGANQAADHILGIDNQELMGREITEAFPPLADTDVPEHYREVCRSGVPWFTEHIDYQDRKIQGAFEVYAFQTTPNSMAALFTDVTERKQQEQARDYRIELDDALVRAISVLLASQDADQAIEKCLAEIARNSQATRAYLTQLCNHDTVFCRTHEWCAPGMTSLMGDLRHLKTEDLPWLIGKLQSNQPVNIHDVGKMPAEAAAEQQFLQSHQITSVLILPLNINEKLCGFVGFDGSPAATVWSEADLTMLRFCVDAMGCRIEHDRLQKKVQDHELRSRQSQKMQAIGELAGGIAHDFNNLLTGIMGNAELIAMMSPAKSDLADMVGQIVAAASNAADLTKQLLAFSRQERLRKRSVNLHRLIEEVQHLLLRSSDPLIEIKLQFNAPNCHTLGDPSWLKMALLNLGLNGRDAMPEGGTLTFTTSNCLPTSTSDKENHSGALIKITVADTGRGMNAEIIDRIFEPFFTTKRQGNGTGLGLASTYGCIESHGGSLKVSSTEGQGSTFTILLPAYHHKQPSATPPIAEIDMSDNHSRGHILVADDDELVRNYANTALEHLGFTVTTARNGPEALAFFENNHRDIDIIILDMTMPKMSSEKVFEELRKINPDSKILASSAYAAKQKAQPLLEKGAVGFLHKPFLLDELAQTVYENIVR